MMLRKTPRRLLLAMTAAGMLLSGATAYADQPADTPVTQGGIGNIDVLQTILDGLLPPLSPA